MWNDYNTRSLKREWYILW